MFFYRDGGTGELKEVYFDEVIVGPYIMPKVAGAFSTLTSGMLSKKDIDGMMGNKFLKRFNMFIDFRNNKIYLQSNNCYYTPITPLLRFPHKTFLNPSYTPDSFVANSLPYDKVVEAWTDGDITKLRNFGQLYRDARLVRPAIN